MNQYGYKEILLRYLYPWLLRTYEGRCFVHQDNDPKHKSGLCMTTCFKYGIIVVSFLSCQMDFRHKIMGSLITYFLFMKPKAPAQSPDLNPIEYVWHALKEHIRSKVPSNQDELERCVFEFLEKLTPEACGRYIDTLKETLRIVIRKGGRWSNK